MVVNNEALDTLHEIQGLVRQLEAYTRYSSDVGPKVGRIKREVNSIIYDLRSSDIDDEADGEYIPYERSVRAVRHPPVAPDSLDEPHVSYGLPDVMGMPNLRRYPDYKFHKDGKYYY